MKSFITYTLRLTKTRGMRWASHIACTGEMKMQTKFWLENLKERHHFEDLGKDGRIILEWIFEI